MSSWKIAKASAPPCDDGLRLRQRLDPLVIVDHLCCRFFFFLQEHELRVKEEATFLWENQ